MNLKPALFILADFFIFIVITYSSNIISNKISTLTFTYDFALVIYQILSDLDTLPAQFLVRNRGCFESRVFTLLRCRNCTR